MNIIFCQLGRSISSVLPGILILAIGIFITIAIFLLIRSFILWYWKVNLIVENQDRQLKELQKLSTLIEQFKNRDQLAKEIEK
jgi:hypothetical protein